MGNKTTVEVTEQTLYNIDILEDETTVVTIEVPEDIVTLEISQFTVSLELYNSDNDVEGQPVFAKSGSDFTLRSFTDDDKTIDISHSGPSNELIQIKLPDTGIRVQDDFVISSDSDDTANIVFNGSTIDINGVGDIEVNTLTAGTATITTGTITTLDGTTATYDTGNITNVNATDITTTTVDATTATIATGNITTVNATDVNTTTLDATGDATVAGNLAVTLDTTIGGDTAITGNVSALNATITNNITATDIDTDTGTIDTLNVVTAEASDEFIGDLRGAIRFRAKADVQLFKGDCVYVSGISGNTPTVDKALASDASKMPGFGLVFADANQNANVEVITFGSLKGLDTATDSLELDKPVYVSATVPGNVTAIRPTDPTHLVQNIGLVERIHQSAGAIKVAGSGRTNDVPNTFSILGDITTAANVSANNVSITNDLTADDATINSGTITTLAGTTATITTVNATDVNTTNVVASGDIDAATGTIDTLDGTTATFTTVNGTTVNATDVNTTDVTATTGDITTINSTTVNATDVNTQDATLTGDITARDGTFSRDVVIGGDLTVNGTTTTINTETLELADNNVVLNSNHTGVPTQDAGITVERGDSDDAVFQWNETDDKFEVKVGATLAEFRADDVDTTTLTATQATLTTAGITTGNITTVNATDVNTTNVDADAGSIDAFTSTTVDATTGNITTVNATDVNTTDLSATGTATIGTADVTQLNTDSIDVAVITGLQGLSASGNIVAQRFNGTWANITNLATVGSLDVGVGDLTVDVDGNLVGASATLSGEVSGETVRMSYLREQVAGSGILVYDDVEFNDVVTLNNTTNSNTIRVSDNPDDFNNKTKYGAFITPDGVTAQTLWSDRSVNLATEAGDVRIGSRINDTSTGSLETLGQNKANSANLVMYGDGSIVWNNTSISPDLDVSLSIHPTGHHLVIDSAEGVEIAAQIRGDLIPRQHLTYDLGSPTKAWHSAYVGPGSLYIDGQKVLGSDATGNIDITTDAGQNLVISSGADIQFATQANASAQNFTVNIEDIQLGPVNSTGTVNIRGTAEIPDLHVGSLEIEPTLINNTGTGANLEIRTNGTGYLHANVADLYVGAGDPGTDEFIKIDETSISKIGGGTLTVTGNLTGDVTGTVSDISNHTTTDLTEGSNQYFTDARAISAVEGEATLDLTGDVTIAQDLDVTGLITVDDGYSFGTFNPYVAYGGTAMPTTVMGIGQESGWAGLTLRSRGEHDWGLSGYGIPASAPRTLLSLSAGRLDGSNDDYLNNGDKFGSVLFTPYSAYRTGTEWLTPSVELEVEATEDHSASGMGAKFIIHTTENGNSGGSTDTTHANKRIEFQGTTISTDDTLKLDDDVIITGTTEFQGNLSSNGSQLVVDDAVKINGSASTKNTIIGDSTIGAYDIHGFTVNAGDTAWAGISLVETTGGASKPINNFSNPAFSTTIFGGTEAAKTGVESGKRIFSAFALASQDGTTPATANFRFLSETTEQQSATARGANFKLETTENGSTGTTVSLVAQGNTITINESGNGVLKSGGDLTLDDAVIVEETLNVKGNTDLDGTLNVDGAATFNGNVTLGDANTDTITTTGKLNTTNGFGFTVLNTATANYLSGVLGIVNAGDAAYISDGDSGNPCLGVYNGSSWKRIALGSDISST